MKRNKLLSGRLQTYLDSISLNSFEVNPKCPKLVTMHVSIPLDVICCLCIWNWELYFDSLMVFIFMIFVTAWNSLSDIYSGRM